MNSINPPPPIGTVDHAAYLDWVERACGDVVEWLSGRGLEPHEMVPVLAKTLGGLLGALGLNNDEAARLLLVTLRERQAYLGTASRVRAALEVCDAASAVGRAAFEHLDYPRLFGAEPAAEEPASAPPASATQPSGPPEHEGG